MLKKYQVINGRLNSDKDSGWFGTQLNTWATDKNDLIVVKYQDEILLVLLTTLNLLTQVWG
jgi:hypothetical protein